MLLDLSFDLVKLRRAGGHHSHGTGTVARSDADCDLLFPKQGMRAYAPAPQSLSELGDAQTLPLFLLIALLSCCGFTVKTVPVSTAKSSHDRDNPSVCASRQNFRGSVTDQASPCGFTEKVYDLPGKILWLSTIHAHVCHLLPLAECFRILRLSRPHSSSHGHRDWWPKSSRSFPRRSIGQNRPGGQLEPVQAARQVWAWFLD